MCTSMLAEDAKDGPQNSDQDSQYLYSYPKRASHQTLVILIIRKILKNEQIMYAYIKEITLWEKALTP